MVGFTRVSKKNFNLCHKFAMGLRSGLSGGLHHQFIPFSSKKALAILEVCLGLLSCMNWLSGSVLRRNGISVLSRILEYKSASIMPLKMQILVCVCRPKHKPKAGALASAFLWQAH